MEAEIAPDEIQKRALEVAERAERANLFTADSDQVRDAEFGALGYLDPNPRQVKRFDNAYRLQLPVANSASDLEFRPEELAALAKWIAIRLRWPELAEDLDREPGLLTELEQHAYNGNTGSTDTGIPERFEQWFSRDSPDQTTFPGYSSRGDTAKYNPAFQGRQMRSDAA